MADRRHSGRLAVACATDDTYAPHCGAMLHSLLQHVPASETDVYALQDGTLAGTNREALRNIVGAAGAKLHWLEVGPSLIAGFPSKRFHIACWYRILLPELLPEVNRLLYVDSDVIVLRDIRPLYEADLEGKMFGAVVNPLYPFMGEHWRGLGLTAATEYLNSGVLVMDLAQMRADRSITRLREYAGAHPDNPWPEQDALSVTCRGRWLALHPKWNVQTTLYDLPASALPLPAEEVAEATSRPGVVHFIGPHKPWHFLCRHPLQHAYLRHRRQTPWPDVRLEGATLVNRLLRPLSLQAQVRIATTFRRAGRAYRALLRDA